LVQGNAQGQFNLAVHYRHGKGVPQNMDTAKEYYRMAAAQGHADSQFQLGREVQVGSFKSRVGGAQSDKMWRIDFQDDHESCHPVAYLGSMVSTLRTGCYIVLSTVAFKFDLRRYSWDASTKRVRARRRTSLRRRRGTAWLRTKVR
jgi:hypothetical protein